MDLEKEHFSDCSPYILSLIYNVDDREVEVIFAKDTISWEPYKRLKIANVVEFKQDLLDDAFDDELIDSMMGFRALSDNTYCLTTEKRELVIKANETPVSEVIE